MATLLSTLRRKIKTLSPALTRHLTLSAAPIPAPSPSPRFLRHASPHPRLTDHSRHLHLPSPLISTLPSGIRVVTQSASSSNTRVASVGVYFDAGSRFELPGTNGTAHFLEHLIFKGTRRRTARTLEVEIENMGAKLNAYTSREQTTYYADVMSEDVGFAFDVLADILQNSTFPGHAIERERGVILREMEEVQGQMEEVIFDHLHEAAFHGHSLGNTILGPEENIRSIKKKDLERYISTHYTGHRMVVSAAGAVDHDEIVEMVGRLFKDFSTDPTTVDQLVDADPAVFTGLQAQVDKEDLPLVHLAIAFKGASWSDPNSIPLMVAQSMLGSWNKSVGVGNCSGAELARRVSTLGLADSIMSFNTNYRDTGLFGIYATAMPECVKDLSSVIMEEFQKLAYQVSEEDVIRAQNQLKSALLLNIDGSTAVAENNGRQMLTYGRVVPFMEMFARIDAVDVATIKETAENFVIDKDVAVAAVGQLGQLPDHDWFRSQTRLEKQCIK